jgi:phosphoglycolate phosphatase
MKYNNVLFDLDGTLTDPYLGITNAVTYSLNKFNIIEEDDNKLKLFIGPPLEKSFMEYYNFNTNDTKIAIAYYREYFSET